MRKRVLILAAVVVALAGGSVAVRSWWHRRALDREVDSIVERAQSLAQTRDGLSPAVVELKRALALAPEDARVLRLLGDAEVRLSKTGDAVEHLRRAVELSDGDERALAQGLLGYALYVQYRGSKREEDFRGARNALQEARKNAAAAADAMFHYAMLFLEKGPNQDPEKALTVLQEFVQKHPDHAEAPRAKEMVELLEPKLRGGGS